jgi:lipopolysaccharide export system ATP-binding protein
MKGFVLSAEDLHKRYGEREVVCEVALEVASGEVIGLLGPNGAGKTTTFNMIVGRIRPTAGRVRLGERDITDLPMYRRARLGITYLPQEPSIFRRLSVAQNVAAILETVEPDSSLRRERLHELLGELGLEDKAHLRGDALSGGERRRVEITRALVLDPKFMLLDEPFSGIDPIAVIDIQKIIEQLKARGIGIIITDHNVRETLSICDRAYIISEGRIVRQGTPLEIASDARVREIYLGENFELAGGTRDHALPRAVGRL